MVTPSRIAHVEGGGFILCQEFADDAQSTCTREGLDCSDSLTADKWAIPAEDHTLGTLIELGKTFDAKVLFV